MNLRLSNRFAPELIAQVIEVRDGNAWAPTEMVPAGAAGDDNVCPRLMCIVAELTEFVEARTPEEREHELADVAMYLLVMLHDLYDGAPFVVRSYTRVNYHAPLEAHAAKIRSYAVFAFEAWRRLTKPARETDVRIALELALLETCRTADALGIDIDAAILAKLEVLRSRPPRHGGKHWDT